MSARFSPFCSRLSVCARFGTYNSCVLQAPSEAASLSGSGAVAQVGGQVLRWAGKTRLCRESFTKWIKGVQPEPELVYQAFSALCETRRLNKAGYARFRNFLLYGERNLAGETVQVDILQDVLTLDYNQERLSQYSVEWQPDDRHFSRVGSPRLYDHRYQSAQLELWQPGEVEWFVIIRDQPRSRKRSRKGRILAIQPPLFSDGTQG